jgi:hypothetical protein
MRRGWRRDRSYEKFMRKGVKALDAGFQKIRCYTVDRVRVTIAEGADDRLHLSVSHPDRYPTWDEVADARYDLMPDGVLMVMPLPPAGDYLNESAFVFNLMECRDPGLEIVRGAAHRRTHESEGRWPVAGQRERAEVFHDLLKGDPS